MNNIPSEFIKDSIDTYIAKYSTVSQKIYHKLYKNSNCGQCKKYTFCKGTESRGVCWKEIIHAYGEDKWNYPDPKCPYAPKEMNQFYII